MKNDGKINTNFHNDKMPKEGSVFIMDKNCYPQLLLEECKYIVKEKEVTRGITEDLENEE